MNESGNPLSMSTLVLRDRKVSANILKKQLINVLEMIGFVMLKSNMVLKQWKMVGLGVWTGGGAL